VERALELGAVIGLDALHSERELLEHVVDELGCSLLVVAVVDAQHADAGAVVDRGELVVLLALGADGPDELDIDLDPVSGQWFLVTLPTVDMALVALGGRQAVHVEAIKDPPHPRRADLDVVIAA